jgi:hypothetical protein
MKISPSYDNNPYSHSKCDFEVAFFRFKSIFNESISMQKIFELCRNCELDSWQLRGIAWRIFLGTIPMGKDIFSWVKRTKLMREEYKHNYIRYNSVRNFNSDYGPLDINLQVI